MRKYGYSTLATVLLLISQSADAAVLGDITVDSRLGEPFHAAIPLTLDAGEDVDVEVANPADYRNHNVHLDPAIRGIRVDVVDGNRIELSSIEAVDAPFFTLVLKVHDEQASHFKAYPIFLEPPGSDNSRRQQNPQPDIKASAAGPDAGATAPVSTPPAGHPAAEVTDVGVAAQPVTAYSFKPFDGWARTSHYGPVVHGDTLYVIAKRLRIDERYTFNQVMAALFEKNRGQFAEENLNLPQDGAYLDVPTAAEVERHTPEQALSIVEDHDRRWQELQKQPRYAAIARAQRNRYNNR